MQTSAPARRSLLLASLALPAIAALPGCAAPLGSMQSPATTTEAAALLAESAAAHGLAAFARMADVSVAYAGTWHALVGKLQPVLVDSGFRGQSEDRLLLRDGIAAQAQSGPDGRKQVVRRTAAGTQGAVRVWYNGAEEHEAEHLASAALVADGYSLFLLGPMLLATRWAAERSPTMELAGTERVAVDDRETLCDVLRVRIAPGIGFSESEHLALFIDRRERLMRRVRFSLDGLDSTKGAVAEVDTFDHVTAHGVRWPTGFHEQLLRPLPLSVHEWRLTGLDVNRGLSAADVSGATYSGKAAAGAGGLP